MFPATAQLIAGYFGRLSPGSAENGGRGSQTYIWFTALQTIFPPVALRRVTIWVDMGPLGTAAAAGALNDLLADTPPSPNNTNAAARGSNAETTTGLDACLPCRRR